MSEWVESASQNFVARHEDTDQRDVGGVLELLEDMRERLGGVFAQLPEDVTIVLHPSPAQLDLAQPFLPIMRRLTTPAARRYVTGWAGRGTLHTLAPRQLAERAANIEGSRELLALTPAALYAQLVVAENNRALPPPWQPRAALRARHWAWLVAGAGQWFSGQTNHARPAIARRLREDRRPDFPPGLRDAALLGGTLVDLVAREQGVAAAVELACTAGSPAGPREALLAAFNGRAMVHSEGTWRAPLSRMAGH